MCKKLSDGININEIIPFDANITPILRYLNPDYAIEKVHS